MVSKLRVLLEPERRSKFITLQRERDRCDQTQRVGERGRERRSRCGLTPSIRQVGVASQHL